MHFDPLNQIVMIISCKIPISDSLTGCVMNSIRNIWFVISLQTVLIFLLYFFQLWRPNQEPSVSNWSQEDFIVLVDERLAVKDKEKGKFVLEKKQEEYNLAPIDTPDGVMQYGLQQARITLQVFSDIECSICRKMHPNLKQIVDSSKGVVKWENRHFPLSMHNPTAAIESQAIECVRESYNNRVSWVALDQLVTETRGNGRGIESMPEFIRSFGLNGTVIQNCLASDSHKERINSDYELGRSLGISATPAIRIIDNKNQKSFLLKGFKTPEQILTAIATLIDT